MSKPRRWTLTGYGNLDMNDPGSRPIEVDGPELADREEIEVVELGHKVLVDRDLLERILVWACAISEDEQRDKRELRGLLSTNQEVHDDPH